MPMFIQLKVGCVVAFFVHPLQGNNILQGLHPAGGNQIPQRDDGIDFVQWGMNCRHGPCGPGNEECGSGPTKVQPNYHLTDASCGMNDPNAPVFDPVHGVMHLSYQKWIAAPYRGPPFRARVYGHFVSRDFVHWARMPVNIWNGIDVSNGNRTVYDNEAIFSGAATVMPGFAPDGKGDGVMQIYPGECAQSVPGCRTGVTIDMAVPANYSGDPLLTNWSKPSFNPIVDGVGIVKGQGDTSSAWQTPSGEWRFRVANQTEYGAANSMDAKLGKWYVIGKNPTFSRGSCPSFYPLPGPTPGTEAVYQRLKEAGALPTHVMKIINLVSLGTYIAGPPKVLGNFSPTPGFEDLYSCLYGWQDCPFEGMTENYGQLLDAGSFTESKDALYPPPFNSSSQSHWRRINWGWQMVVPKNMQSLPREVTFNPVLRQLQWSPIMEQTQLRKELIYTNHSMQLQPGSPHLLKLGPQGEVLITFRLPKLPQIVKFGVIVLAGDDVGDRHLSVKSGLRLMTEYDGRGNEADGKPWEEAVAAGGPASTPLFGHADWQRGYDFSGGDYSVITDWGGFPVSTRCNGDSRVSCTCQHACVRTRGKCKAWALHPGNSSTSANSTCHLKSSIPTPAETDDHVLSGVVDPQQKFQTQAFRLGKDEETVTLRVFVDQTVVEGYWNDGRVAMTVGCWPITVCNLTSAAAFLFTTAPIEVISVQAWTVDSIWVSPEEVLHTPRIDRPQLMYI